MYLCSEKIETGWFRWSSKELHQDLERDVKQEWNQWGETWGEQKTKENLDKPNKLRTTKNNLKTSPLVSRDRFFGRQASKSNDSTTVIWELRVENMLRSLIHHYANNRSNYANKLARKHVRKPATCNNKLDFANETASYLVNDINTL